MPPLSSIVLVTNSFGKATRQSISSPISQTPEPKQRYPSEALLKDLNSFINPRPAPRPPTQENTTVGKVTSGEQSEGYDGTILTSALDSDEVQRASLMALQLAADHPRVSLLSPSTQKSNHSNKTHRKQQQSGGQPRLQDTQVRWPSTPGTLLLSRGVKLPGLRRRPGGLRSRSLTWCD